MDIYRMETRKHQNIENKHHLLRENITFDKRTISLFFFENQKMKNFKRHTNQ